MDKNWVGGLRDSADKTVKLDSSIEGSPGLNKKKDVNSNLKDPFMTNTEMDIDPIKINDQNIPLNSMKRKVSPKKVDNQHKKKDIFDELFDNIKPDDVANKNLPSQIQQKTVENPTEKKTSQVKSVPLGSSTNMSAFMDDQMKVDFLNKLKGELDMGIITEMPSLATLIDPLIKMVTVAHEEINFLFDPIRDVENGEPYYKDGDLEHYSTENMEKRKALKEETMVKKRINTFMNLFQIDKKTNCVTRESYIEVFTKIGGILHPSLPKSEIDELVELDWEHDSKESEVPVKVAPSNQISRRDTELPSKTNLDSESEIGVNFSENQTELAKEDNRILTKDMLFESLFE